MTKLVWMIRHELLHCLFRHRFIREQRNKRRKREQRNKQWNKAAANILNNWLEGN